MAEAASKKLTAKQQKFVDEYMLCNNACEAYRKAYSVKKMDARQISVESTRLMQHPSVSLAVTLAQQKARAVAEKKFEITKDKLTKMALDAFSEASVRGAATGQAQSAAMTRAAEFLAKLHGLMVERREIGAPGEFAGMTDAELVSYVERARQSVRDGGETEH